MIYKLLLDEEMYYKDIIKILSYKPISYLEMSEYLEDDLDELSVFGVSITNDFENDKISDKNIRIALIKLNHICNEYFTAHINLHQKIKDKLIQEIRNDKIDLIY